MRVAEYAFGILHDLARLETSLTMHEQHAERACYLRYECLAWHRAPALQ